MPSFLSIEMDLKKGEPTGRVETYIARNIKQAVKKVHYYHSLSRAKCKIGPSGRTVVCGRNRVYVVKPEK
jgi:hypothetical protein